MNLSTCTRILILAAFYFVGGVLGKKAAFMADTVVLVWPPFGIALAAILLFGYRYWPAVALGTVFYGFVSDIPLSVFTFGTVLGNTMGALVCAYLLERFVQFRPALARVRDVTGFMLLACLLGTTVNAAFNGVSLCYAGKESWDNLFSLLLEWWVPNAMAGLVVAPVILTWSSPSHVRWQPRRVLEAAGCGAGLIAGTLISFNTYYVYGIQNYPLAYLPYPFLIWGALRFGPRGATAGTLVVSTLSILDLLRGTGPFVASTEKESLMLIGSYIGVLSISNLLLAAAAAQRDRAEQALRESEEFFRLISDSMTDMVAVIDRNGRRLYNSPSYKSVLGDPTALAGTDSFEEIHPDDRQIVKRIFDETIATGVGQRAEYRFVRKDGAIRKVESVGSVIRDAGGKVSKVVVVSRDMTDRLNLEEQLRQSMKMEAIGRLAGGIAHDFNNLMQAILGYTSLTLQRLAPNDANRATLVEIEKSAERAASLTGQLLAFSRKQVLKPAVLSLNAVVGDMEKLLRRLIGEHIHLVVQPADDAGMVQADRSQVEQVILNLALNARDAMPNGGTLTITTENADLETHLEGFAQDFCPGRYVRLSLRDTGAGMTPEVRAHLFEPFFTTKGMGKGTGLGLSIVYGIIKQSGGEVNCQSEAGRGSVFNIFLPRVDGEPASLTPVAPVFPARPEGQTTVLVAEDEDVVRELLVEILQSDGYTVLSAKNGREALELAARHPHPIHLLVTDLMMPQLNGWELASQLVKTRPELAIIYISGYTNDDLQHQIQITERTIFLQKPFHLATLLGKIREILHQPKAG